ncbi:MAG: hypothetical protein WBP72_16345 [Rhodocyclaceae bacterium]
MNAAGWMLAIGLGGIVGAVGQLIRVIAGLRKLNESADATETSLAASFSASRLVVSILIVGVAGALAAISMGFNPADKISSEVIVALLGSGYAGADFIEAFMRKSRLPVPSESEKRSSSNEVYG